MFHVLSTDRYSYQYFTIQYPYLHSVWTGPVRGVVELMQSNLKTFFDMFFDSLIKLTELYSTVEKHFEVQ
eukprot:SAG31_NODE_3236_length_4509_cov_2.012472_4_plen_70_part_00